MVTARCCSTSTRCAAAEGSAPHDRPAHRLTRRRSAEAGEKRSGGSHGPKQPRNPLCMSREALDRASRAARYRTGWTSPADRPCTPTPANSLPKCGPPSLLVMMVHLLPRGGSSQVAMMWAVTDQPTWYRIDPKGTPPKEGGSSEHGLRASCPAPPHAWIFGGLNLPSMFLHPDD